MKQKLSITIDEENVRQMEKMIQEGAFRNKSHIVEFAIARLINEIINEKNEKASKKSNKEKEKK